MRIKIFISAIIVLIIIGIGSIYFRNASLIQDTATPASADTLAGYSYQGDFIDPNFRLNYPQGFVATTSSTTADWDITLSKGQTEIKIDFSGGDDSISEAANNWITLWNSLNPTYTTSIAREGTTPLGTSYQIYQVNEEGKPAYILLVAEIGNSYNSKGYLAIKTDTGDIDLATQIIGTITRL